MMINSVRFTFFLAMILSLAFTGLSPNLSWAWGSLQGTVRSADGQALAGAKVTSSLGVVSQSIDDGTFSMTHQAGTYTFIASAQGYQDQSLFVTLTDLATTTRNFSLTEIPIDIKSVTPNWGEIGTDLAVTIQGTSFTADTRAFMTYDGGNRKQVLGSFTEWGTYENVTVVGDRAYIQAQASNTLLIIDVSNPSSPTTLGSVTMPAGYLNSVSFAVAGSTVYAAAISYDSQIGRQVGELKLIDVSAPANPTVIGSVELMPGYSVDAIRDVTVVGGTAYVASIYSDYLIASQVGTLEVIDVSNQAYPVVMGTVDTVGSAKTVKVFGSRAYVLGDNVIQIVGLSDLAHPVVIGSITGNYSGLSVVGSTAYVTTSENSIEGQRSILQVIDVSDPAQPNILGSVETPYPLPAEDIAVVGNTVYVPDHYAGLQIVDVQNPAMPTIINSIAVLEATYIAIDNGRAYVVSASSGLTIVDVNPVVFTNPSIATPGVAYGVAVVGDTVYVADGASGLQVISTSDINHPVIIGAVDTPGVACDVELVGDTAYVTDGGSGLQIINVSDPVHPHIIGSVDTTGTAHSVKVVADIAYVADGSSGLQVIDVHDPTQPEILATVSLDVEIAYPYDPSFPMPPIHVGGNARDVAISGNRAFVAGSTTGLQVVDVTVPETPSRLTPSFREYYEGSITEATGVTVVGSTAYVIGQSGLNIYDVSSSGYNGYGSLIGTVGGTYYSYFSSGLLAVGNRVYVPKDFGGIMMIDTSDPSHSAIIGGVDTPGLARSVAVSGNTAYIADSANGLTIVPLPAEITPLTVVSDTELKGTLPSPPIVGNYNLQVIKDASHSDTLIGAVTFSPVGTIKKGPIAQGRITQGPKAIIVAGYGPHPANWLWQETKRNAHYAYNALLWQGYPKENIQLLSAENLDVDGNAKLDDVDADANLINLQQAVSIWAQDADELLLYLVDHGGTGTFEIKHTASTVEILTANTLAGWLNTLQGTMLGRVIVMNESCYSGSFVDPLKVPAGSALPRIVLTSSRADEKTKFQENGRLSFAYQFWAAIFEGAKLTTAFNHAKVMMKEVQTAWLDGNGDGVANTYNEGDLSNVVIGRGYKSAPGAPTIVEVAEPQVLAGGGTGATLAIGQVASLNPVVRAWAVIVPPDYDPNGIDSAVDTIPTVELTPTGSGATRRYESFYNGFASYGVYKVAYYVMDDKETISQPRSSVVTQSEGADAFEPDDSASQAGTIAINVATPQLHTFQQANDSDWLKFQAIVGEDYTIEAKGLGVNNDVVIELYGTDGSTQLDLAHTIGEPRADEFLNWTCPQTGIYYVKYYTVNGGYGPGTEYEATINRDISPGFGTLKGTILDSVTFKPIAGVSLISSDGASDLTGANGSYELVAEAGSATLNVRASGYGDKTQVVQIPANAASRLDIPLTALDAPNQAPTAQAGPDQMSAGGVSLDGSGSSDPEGSTLTYAWSLTHRTDPSANRSAGGVSPLLSDLALGFYDVTLTVTDAGGLMARDSLVLVVANGDGGFTQAQLDQAVTAAVATAVTEKDQSIIQLTQQIADRDQTISQQTLQLADKEQTIQTKDQILTRLCVSRDLESGFNLVGFACPPEGYTAHQFLNDLGPSAATSIQRFDGTAGAFATAAFDQNSQVAGPDFPLLPGQGYIIYMKQAVHGVQP